MTVKLTCPQKEAQLCLHVPGGPQSVLSKQQLLSALSGLVKSVTFCPHMSLCCLSRALYACFWEQSTQHSLLFFDSFKYVQKQHYTGFVFRDKISDLLTLDQFFPIAHLQSVSKTVCQFCNAWLYVSTQICTVI